MMKSEIRDTACPSTSGVIEVPVNVPRQRIAPIEELGLVVGRESVVSNCRDNGTALGLTLELLH
jgi:hypothetical protein